MKILFVDDESKKLKRLYSAISQIEGINPEDLEIMNNYAKSIYELQQTRKIRFGYILIFQQWYFYPMPYTFAF